MRVPFENDGQSEADHFAQHQHCNGSYGWPVAIVNSKKKSNALDPHPIDATGSSHRARGRNLLGQRHELHGYHFPLISHASPDLDKLQEVALFHVQGEAPLNQQQIRGQPPRQFHRVA